MSNSDYQFHAMLKDVGAIMAQDADLHQELRNVTEKIDRLKETGSSRDEIVKLAQQRSRLEDRIRQQRNNARGPTQDAMPDSAKSDIAHLKRKLATAQSDLVKYKGDSSVIRQIKQEITDATRTIREIETRYGRDEALKPKLVPVPKVGAGGDAAMDASVSVGQYCTDRSDSSRYNKTVYRVMRVIDDTMAECQVVGELVNGQMRAQRGGTTHRKIANLQSY